jgi:hypothetical protein
MRNDLWPGGVIVSCYSGKRSEPGRRGAPGRRSEAGKRGEHDPVAGLGAKPEGQHVPQDDTCVGEQQTPSAVIACVGSEQGVTHLPLTRTCPSAQDLTHLPPMRVIPLPHDGGGGGGHMPPGLLESLGASFVPLQRHTEIPLWAPAACVPEGQLQEKM